MFELEEKHFCSTKKCHFFLAIKGKKATTTIASLRSIHIMPNIVKNALFLLFFCSFAGGVFYVSTSSDVLHLSEKIFLGEIGFSKETKTQILTGDFSITLENNEV